MVCRLHKVLYGLKQAPRAWYERLHKYLVKIGFEKIVDNNNLYIKEEKGKDVLISEIFVDDIIFGGKDALCKDFSDQMINEFEMSMFGEIKFFVALQVHQLKHGIFVTQSKYTKEILKTFGLFDPEKSTFRWRVHVRRGLVPMERKDGKQYVSTTAVVGFEFLAKDVIKEVK